MRYYCVLFIIAVSLSSTNGTVVYDNIRLPSDLLPFYYDIRLWTNFSYKTQPTRFNGTVQIDFACVRNTSKIVLHSKRLEINNDTIKIKCLNDTTNRLALNYTRVVYNTEKEFLIIEFEGDHILWSNNSYRLFIEYEGVIRGDNEALFSASYIDSKGSTKWLVASQMQLNNARKAFPSFDEPWMKAQFRISVIHHKYFTVLSNMPALSTKQVSYDLVETTFEKSILMSTYLVALVISDFNCEYSSTKRGVKIGVCGRTELKNRFSETVRNFNFHIKYYEEYFGINYPLSKCDNVGIPDYVHSAMENFGLIVYQEQSLSSKTIINHEVVHVWFGNLVTPEWWDELWLSEGFATYMQHEDQEIASFLIHTFHSDSYQTSYPLHMKIEKLNQIELVFNKMVYFKGALVLRMLKSIMGVELFDLTVKHYINKYKYSHVRSENLFETIQEVSLNVVEMVKFRRFLFKQMNKKNISVNASAFLNTWFLFNPVTMNNTRKWRIPFTFVVKNAESSQKLLGVKKRNVKAGINWLTPNENEKFIKLSKPMRKSDYVLGNVELTGFYRVNYDTETWSSIIKQLIANHEAIPLESRIQLVNDLFSLSRNGLVEFTMPFKLFEYLKNEKQMFPWRIAINHLTYMSHMLESCANDTVYPMYQKYLVRYMTRIYTRFFIGNEDIRTTIGFNFDVFKFACELGVEECVSYLKKEYLSAQDKSSKGIPFYLYELILCTVLRYGPTNEWDNFASIYEDHKDSPHARGLQRVLTCTKDTVILERYLNDQLNETKSSKFFNSITNVARATNGTSIVWKFMKNNWSQVSIKFTNSYVAEACDFISTITDKLNTEAQLNEFITLFQTASNYDSLSKSFDQAIEKVHSNIYWTKRNLEKLKTWLKSQ